MSLYLTDGDGRSARLVASSGVAPGSDISPATIDLRSGDEAGWPIGAAIRSDVMQVGALAWRTVRLGAAGSVVRPSRHRGRRADSIEQGRTSRWGAIVAGVSARLKFDDHYADFFELVADADRDRHRPTPRAYEDERRRAEALAEIDRAKTAFFSNVSHEFRTPLTLMLGPIEDLLAGANGALSDGQRDGIEIVHRNAGRLLKLVNALLDFSRIEAGRAQATYRPTD